MGAHIVPAQQLAAPGGVAVPESARGALHAPSRNENTDAAVICGRGADDVGTCARGRGRGQAAAAWSMGSIDMGVCYGEGCGWVWGKWVVHSGGTNLLHRACASDTGAFYG